MEPKRHTEKPEADSGDTQKAEMPEEFGGSNKPEPTRYGDWEVNGRCTDF